jgi:hypothetical protein
VLSSLLELVYRPPSGPHCAPTQLLDTLLRALPPPVPGLSIRLQLPGGGSTGGGVSSDRPMFAADCKLPHNTPTHG